MSGGETGPGVEKRVAHRHEMVNFVWFHLLGEDGASTGIEGVGKMVDLSETGVGIKVMNSTLANGNRVFLSITTDAETFCVTGRVAYSIVAENNYSRLGIQFEVVPPQYRLFLKSLGKKDEKGKTQ